MSLAFRTLHASPLVTVNDVTCTAGCGHGRHEAAALPFERLQRLHEPRLVRAGGVQFLGVAARECTVLPPERFEHGLGAVDLLLQDGDQTFADVLHLRGVQPRSRSWRSSLSATRWSSIL